jgi:hypothetical protein
MMTGRKGYPVMKQLASLLVLLCARAFATAPQEPIPVEGDFTIRGFRFESGRVSGRATGPVTAHRFRLPETIGRGILDATVLGCPSVISVSGTQGGHAYGPQERGG